jgi:hypothetical protein
VKRLLQILQIVFFVFTIAACFGEASARESTRQLIVYAGFDIGGAVEKLVPKWMDSIKAKYPDTKVVLKIQNSGRCQDMLKADKADLIIVSDLLWTPRGIKPKREIFIFENKELAKSARLGQFVVAFAVHPRSKIRKIDFSQIQELLSILPENEAPSAPFKKTTKIYGQSETSKSYEVLRKQVLTMGRRKNRLVSLSPLSRPIFPGNKVEACLGRRRNGGRP